MKRLLPGNARNLLLFIALVIASLLLIPTVHQSQAATTDLVPNDCLIGGTSDPTCHSQINANDASIYSITKGNTLDGPLSGAGLPGNATVNSVTVYYDVRAVLSGTYAVSLTDGYGGSSICNIDPAPENGAFMTYTLSCSSTTLSQLNSGQLHIRIVNNDDKAPESVDIDYLYLHIDYTTPTPTPTPSNTPTPTPTPTPVLSISLSTDGTVGFGTLGSGSVMDTTTSGTNDIQTVVVDTGPATINVSSTQYEKLTTTTNSWSLGSSPATDVCKWEYSSDGSSWGIFLTPATNYTLCTNVSQSSSCSVYFRLSTPSVNTVYGDYQADITLTAVSP